MDGLLWFFPLSLNFSIVSSFFSMSPGVLWKYWSVKTCITWPALMQYKSKEVGGVAKIRWKMSKILIVFSLHDGFEEKQELKRLRGSNLNRVVPFLLTQSSKFFFQEYRTSLYSLTLTLDGPFLLLINCFFLFFPWVLAGSKFADLFQCWIKFS